MKYWQVISEKHMVHMFLNTELKNGPLTF